MTLTLTQMISVIVAIISATAAACITIIKAGSWMRNQKEHDRAVPSSLANAATAAATAAATQEAREQAKTKADKILCEKTHSDIEKRLAFMEEDHRKVLTMLAQLHESMSLLQKEMEWFTEKNGIKSHKAVGL